jgi:hypothetical protein
MAIDHSTTAKLHPPITSSGACTPRYILESPTRITSKIIASFQGLVTYGRIIRAQTILNAECPDGKPNPDILYCLDEISEMSSSGLGRAIVSLRNCVHKNVAALNRKTWRARSHFLTISNQISRHNTIQPLPKRVITIARLYNWFGALKIELKRLCSMLYKFCVEAMKVEIMRITADTARPIMIGCRARFPLGIMKCLRLFSY